MTREYYFNEFFYAYFKENKRCFFILIENEYYEYINYYYFKNKIFCKEKN